MITSSNTNPLRSTSAPSTPRAAVGDTPYLDSLVAVIDGWKQHTLRGLETRLQEAGSGSPQNSHHLHQREANRSQEAIARARAILAAAPQVRPDGWTATVLNLEVGLTEQSLATLARLLRPSEKSVAVSTWAHVRQLQRQQGNPSGGIRATASPPIVTVLKGLQVQPDRWAHAIYGRYAASDDASQRRKLLSAMAPIVAAAGEFTPTFQRILQPVFARSDDDGALNRGDVFQWWQLPPNEPLHGPMRRMPRLSTTAPPYHAAEGITGARGSTLRRSRPASER